MNVDALVERLPVLGPWYRTTDGRKKLRYAMVSVVAVPIGTIGVFLFNLLGAPAVWAAILGNSVAAVPSYLLNRYWVWGKQGRNRFFTEILPFWALTLLGIAFSAVVAHLADHFAKHHDITGLTRDLLLALANLAGFGVLWVAKYIIFNKVLFVVKHRPDERTTVEG